MDRPVFLNLFQIKFPITAIVSIFHRISGVAIFLLLPLYLYLLHLSLLSPDGFASVVSTMHYPVMKLIVWLSFAALIFHLLAGVRHLIMDLGYLEHLHTARFTAYLIIALAVILAILFGVWLW